MLRDEVNEFRLLKAICQHFPGAEIVRPDGSRKKLSEMFSRATEKKSTTEIFFQCTQPISPLSSGFGDDSSKRGAT